MKKVLFVCLGNICRSPMAEGLFQKEAEIKNFPLVIDSAATSSWEIGNPPHPGTQEKLRQLGISCGQMRARKIQLTDFETYDWIIAMDQSNRDDLLKLAPKKYHEKICTYLSVVPEAMQQDIPDPYYTGDFSETLRLLNEGKPYWLKKFGYL